MKIQKGDLLQIKSLQLESSPVHEVGIIMSVDPPEPGSPFWIISYYSSAQERIVYESFEGVDPVTDGIWSGHLLVLKARRHT